MWKLRRASSPLKRLKTSSSEQLASSAGIPCSHGAGTSPASKVSSSPGCASGYAGKATTLGVSSRNCITCARYPSLIHVGVGCSPPFFLSGCNYGGFRCLSTENNLLNRQSRSYAAQAIREAREALMDYLHCTRTLQFTDAEHISRNSPTFLDELLQKVKDGEDVGRSITRYLHFHPINEFEPFFESLGLAPSEFEQFLPRGLMFLSDDRLMLASYQILVNYGIPRTRIGKIYREATEIFCQDHAILSSKLQFFEGLGLSKTSVIKIISASPALLIGDVDPGFIRVLEDLQSMGIDREWISGNISADDSYDWEKMLLLLCLLRDFGFSEEEMGKLLCKHPGILLDNSGKMVFLTVGLLVKLGATRGELLRLFVQFPALQLQSFVKNLHFSLQFLIKIEMDPEDIRKVVCSHAHVLGSCFLKTPYSVVTSLCIGTKRLCRIIKEDPHQFTKWVLGKKINRLPSSRYDQALHAQKEKFLLSLGFIEHSKEMEKALAAFRGKGDELQDRYNCFVDAGLDPKDVTSMIKLSPHILNQTRHVLESKMDFLVNSLGYPLHSLVTFPSFMSYTTERVELRFLMYNWLKNEGKLPPNLALSTILATSEKQFEKRFVKKHINGPKTWENFKSAMHLN